MGYTSISHWIIVAPVVLVLFGRGRLSETMAEFGKGMSSFRRGLAEASDDQPKVLDEAARIADPDQTINS